MSEREISCPLCGYETIVWDDEAHWCHNCFGGRRPAADSLLKPLAMGHTSVPMIDIVTNMLQRLRNEGFGDDMGKLNIYAGTDVAAVINDELNEMSRVNTHTALSDVQPMIRNVPVATLPRFDKNQLRVADERGMTHGSQHAVQSVRIPWQVFEDG